ncbi:conserved Plasmodium protein, unknown function [Plasmodium malariae]|uniref:EF-hand domain-containing protein n=1 Tax=Plasmodium malariae TaxID=5858 RepID=A0A1A8W635_PLAMA|nr:conserved Plasmodium protein, unknown function [Plasmodium malariae]
MYVIFLKYPLFILKENIFENLSFSKNECLKEKDARYCKSVCRLLIEDDIDFFNIEQLKNLLYFQSKLEKQIRRTQKEENKLEVLKQAVKNGNFIGYLHFDQKANEKKENYDTNIDKKEGVKGEENKENDLKNIEYGNQKEKEVQIDQKSKNNMNSEGEIKVGENIQLNKNSLARNDPIIHDRNENVNENPNEKANKKENEKTNEKLAQNKITYEPQSSKVLEKTQADKFIKKHEHLNNSSDFGSQNKEEGKYTNNFNLNKVLKGADFSNKLELLKNYISFHNEADNIGQSLASKEHSTNEQKQDIYANDLKINKEKIIYKNTQGTNFNQDINNNINKYREEDENVKLAMSNANVEKKENDTHDHFYNTFKNDDEEKTNIRLRGKYAKEMLDVNDLVKYMKNFLGIKSNIHEKFEHEKLILKNCNYESFGPDYCSVNEEAKEMLWNYEKKKNSAFLFIILFTLFFSLLIQNVVYYIEKRVRNSKDQFRKDLLNTAFRQISLITIINLTIWGILQSNIAEALDAILPQQRNVDEILHNVEPLLEIIFEKILFISMNFLICYSLFIINIHFVTRKILKWFSESDNCDISTVAKELKEYREGCFKNLFFISRYGRNSKYLAHRYDFSENVDAISIPGLDPNGYYYYEYMRACLLKYNLYRIDRKLLPRDISKYLLNRYHIETCDQNKKDITPYYKLLKQQSVYPSTINYFLYKTTFPNKHEQLFFLWGNGPPLINFIFQVWEFERSDNIKRISEFIDAIKIKSTLHALKEGGEVFWRQLLIKSNTVPSNIQEKMFSIWIGLDEENRGIIDSAKILKFLKSQGINLTSEHDIKEFLEVFDRNNKNGLNQEEFFVLIIIVKQILVELLDINAVQSLFEEVYGIPWNSLSSIDVNSLKRILSELNLQWPHGKIRNLIDFVCENKKTKYVSAEYFIKQLINIEEFQTQNKNK